MGKKIRIGEHIELPPLSLRLEVGDSCEHRTIVKLFSRLYP